MDEDVRRLSLRIEESLATMVDKLSRDDGRSFNSEVLELIKKGISLNAAEKKLLKNTDPLHVVNKAAPIDEDDSPKHRRAPDNELETGKRGKDREFA